MLVWLLKQYVPRISIRSSKKRSFSLAFLQDLAGVFWSFAGILLQDSCKIPQDLAGMQEEWTYSWKILQERFYWVVSQET